MQIFEEIATLKNFTNQQQKAGNRIGLVPTMGALHRGHMKLIDLSLENSDVTVCSIYVNPIQFNSPRDLINYPRDLKGDLRLLEQKGCRAVFAPGDEIIYPQDPMTKLSFGPLEMVMEGSHRPGHFAGVALVVAKLFNLVEPQLACFGEKDWQQLMIVKRLVIDLNFPIEIKAIPIIREPDGLALSSRNQRLSVTHRTIAPQLYQALCIVRNALEAGSTLSKALKLGLAHLEQFPEIELEYLEIVEADSLQPPSSPPGKETLRICLAAALGNIRLIDNIQVF